MGTKVQSKTYFPGSMRDLNNNLCNGMWDLYREDSTSANSQYYDSFLTRPAIGGYAGYAKEQMRQTILKQESIFRHQLQELHCLYRRQRDLMNELTRGELHNYQIPAETSKSTPFLSQPSDFPLMDSTFGQVSTSGTDGIQNSPLSFVKGKSTLKDWTPQRRMFDLELPADEYENSEGSEHLEKIHSSGLNSDYIGDPLGSTLSKKRAYNLADLNEPIQVEETSLSASVNYLNNTGCLTEELQRRDASVNSNSGFWFSSKFSQNFLVEREGGICHSDSHLERERHRKEQLTYNFTAGSTRCDEHAYFHGIHPDLLPKLSNSLQVEPRKALDHLTFPVSDQIKAEPHRKRTIFGVEICERNHKPSFDASYTPCSHASNPQSDTINTESSFALPSRMTLSSSGNHWLGSFNPSSGSPNSMRQLPEFLGGKMCGNSNSRLIPSPTSGVPYQSGSCIGSILNSKQLQGCSSSVSVGFQSSINSMKSVSEKFDGLDCIDLTSENDLNRDSMLKIALSCQLNSVPADGQKRHQNPERGLLPWLITKPDSLVEQNKGKEILYQMNLDSLQNHSQQFFKKAEIKKGASPNLACEPEIKKVKIDDCQSVTKLLGFPIVDVPDMISPGHSSKTSDHASNAEDKNVKKDYARDDEAGNDHEVKENGLNDDMSDLRHHIDLNLSLNEEEAPSAPSFPKAIVKIATTEIDLEAPAVLDADSPEIELQIPSKLPSDDSSTDSLEELVKVAAEAIIAISASELDTSSASCQPPDDSPSGLLLWFAEVISSDDVSKGLITCDGEFIPEGMDYFEFMTLKLQDTKEEEYCYYKPMILDNEKDEGVSLTKRPRKGQGRRGRQRKDFQRDILPSIVSLSRREVTEDLQTFEEVFTAIGVTWQSSLSKRKAARNNRGRRHLSDKEPSQTAIAVGPIPVQQQQQQPICREVALDEKSLSGWGKRTRRLPRQRCPNGNANHTLALKC